MTAHQNGSISTEFSDFLLNCFVRSPSWQLWLSLPLSLLFLLAMGVNTTLLITIRLEASLHEPMYYLLSLLSLLDMALCLTVIPKVLAIFWFDLRSISFFACFLQMFTMNTIFAMESCTFMVMAYDRYVAICHPLSYLSIITVQFVVKAAIFISARSIFLTVPIPILSGRLHYCWENVIENCLCANMSVSRLSCGDIIINCLYQFACGWTLLGLDLILIFLSYTLILRAHMWLPLHPDPLLQQKKVSSDVPVLLNILHHIIPPALNPIVYGVRTQEIKQGIQRLLKKGW
uniref:G-protein coupled receptors family 1 profile domain-containing protein n=1 Tax=Capra hircus TaxID=9925 RepID=A0A452F379_CAPHI